MKRGRLNQNARIGNYRILEFAGQTETHSLYTATKGDPNEAFWLLESNQPLERLAGGQVEAFQVKAIHYLAFPVEGTSAAALARLVGAADWKFIVPRWAALAEQVGHLHSKGQVFQQGSPLDLNTLLFNNQVRFLPLAYSKVIEGATVFRAPELARGAATPASDVFALGAGLLFLLGGGSADVASLKNRLAAAMPASPRSLTKILTRATDPDPVKRFRDAGALADALYTITPRSGPAQGQPARRALQSIRVAILCSILVIALIPIGMLIRQGPAVLSDVLSALTPVPTLAPTAVPTGELALDVASINVTPDRVGHIELRFTRGGKPLAQELPAEFAVTVNGAAVPRVDVYKSLSGANGGLEYRYSLSFDTSPLPAAVGTYLITARMIGANLSGTIYYDGSAVSTGASQSNGGAAPGSTVSPNGGAPAGLAITGIQVDSQHYPDLTLYFNVSGNGGTVPRLQGPLTVQVEQDGQVVTGLAMAQNDPTANPITVALAVDVSGSMQGSPNVDARQAAIDFVNALGASDMDCVYAFSTAITPVQKCTTDRQATANAIRTLGAVGNTSLYEALVGITGDLAKMNGRKAIVLLSDGADTASRIRKQDALARLKQTNIPVYAVGLASYQFQPAVLRELADGTGGSYLQAPTATGLSALFGLINAQLRNQYRVSFKSIFPDRKNGTLTIRLVEGNEKIEAQYSFFVSK